MKIAKFMLLLFLPLLIVSCGNGAKYSKSISISDGKWAYENPLTYEFEVESTETLNDLFLSIKYGTDFGYENIYVKIVTEYPTKTSTEDIVSLNLTNGAGSFLGNCNNSTCTTDILLQEKFRFEETGKHTIKIYQHSRDPLLESIFSGELKVYEKIKS